MRRTLLFAWMSLSLSCGCAKSAEIPQPPSPDTRLALNLGTANLDRPERNILMANLAADTGVRWVYAPVFWPWSEPFEGDYRWQGLDATIDVLMQRGITVVIQIRGMPAWASGAPCDVIAGTPRECAQVKTQSKLRSAYGRFAGKLAERYPYIKYWAVGNEPNLAEYGPPTPCDYMSLLMLPAATAIREVIPDAEVFGPELYTNGGDWLSWARFFLSGWPGYFPRFTVHHYAPDQYGPRHAVALLWDLMVEIGEPRPLWLTEFNFDQRDERAIADRICLMTKHQAWGRSFLFQLSGGPNALADETGIPRAFLYPAFRAIAAGAYGCR
jgi:hypothetical protein